MVNNLQQIQDNNGYHLVMTNSSPWKIPEINGGF
jgi:hypothetical protein